MPNRDLLVLTRYDAQDPSARLRILQFLPSLIAAGWHVDTHSLSDAHDLSLFYETGRRDWPKLLMAYAIRLQRVLSAHRYDRIWVHRELFPFLPGALERLIGRAGQRCIVDYDDALFHRYDQHPNPVVRAFLGTKLNPLLSRIAAATACNQYLCDQLSRRGAKRTVMMPTVIDPARYLPTSTRTHGEDTQPIRIGWIGTPSTTIYLRSLLPVLRQLAATHSIQLVTIGAAPVRVDGFEVEAHPWSENTEADLLASIDIGVMPLRDGAWERGKCGYKLIQYMACAKPVVASAVGVNLEVVSTETGFIAHDDRDWLQALQQLCNAHHLRQHMGNAGRKRVLQHYSVSQVLPTLMQLMGNLACA